MRSIWPHKVSKITCLESYAMQIIEANSPQHFSLASDLFKEYQKFLNADLCFQGFEEELASLPGKYAKPIGSILLAKDGNDFVGCVAVRAIKGKTCEMKRLYVKPSAQGKSIGRLLAESIIRKARQLGYNKMQLDTLKRLESAISLYSKLGFKEIKPYYANPLDDVVYWELEL